VLPKLGIALPGFGKALPRLGIALPAFSIAIPSLSITISAFKIVFPSLNIVISVLGTPIPRPGITIFTAKIADLPMRKAVSSFERPQLTPEMADLEAGRASSP
jgi:hypothetical protein